MSTLDPAAARKALLDNKKELLAHIAQFKSVLTQADYIYFSTDSILSKGSSFLWPLVIDSGVLSPASFILVAPALKNLTELPAYKEAQGNRGECITLREDTDKAWEKPEFFSSFKYSLENRRRGSAIGANLHLMNHAKEEWNASGRLSSALKETWGEITEQQAIQQAVFNKHKDYSQIVISQDVNFLKELHSLCKSQKGKTKLLTLHLDDAGYLADPFDTTESDLLTKISINKLTELVQSAPLFIDDSALKHAQSETFLHHIKSVLISTEKQLSVLAFKKESLPQSDLLIARAQETPCTIRFSWLDERFDKTNALIAALLAESAQNQLPHIVLITDRVSRAEKIMARVAGMGLQVDIYSINKFGFLSSRVSSQSRKKASASLQGSRTTERIEAAIRAGNVTEVLGLASDPESWETCVMTSLCQGNVNVLESLVNQADRVTSRLIRWIITDFRQFQRPTYLAENPRVYELLVKMLSKNTGFPVNIAEQLYEHLCDINDNMTASHVELEYLASLFQDAKANAVGSVMPLARIRRAMLTEELPHSEINPKLALELHKKEFALKKERIRSEIARLQAELAELEKQDAAIVADFQSFWESKK